MTKVYKAHPTSRAAISSYAKQFRRLCGYEKTLAFPVIQFLELVLPRLFPDFNLEIAEEEDLPFREGETLPGSNTIRLRSDIYLAACEGDGRARFTVAHEIGHFLLHTPDSIALCRMEEGQTLRAFEDPEWQANFFAGELLAPVYLAKGMTKHQIMDAFQISEAAAKVTINKCNKCK